MTHASFYIGNVHHARLSGPGHQFDYGVAYVCIDLDRAEKCNDYSKLFGWNKRRVMNVNPKDHGDGKTDNLARWVRKTLRKNGVDRSVTKIDLFTMPRIFGYVFNPISIYFVYEGNDTHHVLYEVNNTFGGRHFYLMPVETSRQSHNHKCEKEFYVSPFFDVEGCYEFSLSDPAETMKLLIKYFDGTGTKALTASFTGQKAKITTGRCVKTLLAFPFMTLGVMLGIHWQALKLFLKGARVKDAKGREKQFGKITGEQKTSTVRRGKISEAELING